MADRNLGHALNVVMKAYLDNVIESGRALEDLPEDEMHALRSLLAAAKAGELELVTSRESWREQERTQDVAKRAQLEAARNMERSADAVVVPCRSRGDPRWCLPRGRGRG